MFNFDNVSKVYTLPLSLKDSYSEMILLNCEENHVLMQIIDMNGNIFRPSGMQFIWELDNSCTTYKFITPKFCLLYFSDDKNKDTYHSYILM